MPTAKSDQVITHRIELQQTERKLLEQYIKQQNDGIDDPRLALLKILSNGSTGFFISAGVCVAAPLAIYCAYWWKIRLEAALASLDPATALNELKENSTGAIGAGISSAWETTGLSGLDDLWGSVTGFFGDD